MKNGIESETQYEGITINDSVPHLCQSGIVRYLEIFISNRIDNSSLRNYVLAISLAKLLDQISSVLAR